MADCEYLGYSAPIIPVVEWHSVSRVKTLATMQTPCPLLIEFQQTLAAWHHAPSAGQQNSVDQPTVLIDLPERYAVLLDVHLRELIDARVVLDGESLPRVRIVGLLGAMQHRVSAATCGDVEDALRRRMFFPVEFFVEFELAGNHVTGIFHRSPWCRLGRELQRIGHLIGMRESTEHNIDVVLLKDVGHDAHLLCVWILSGRIEWR